MIDDSFGLWFDEPCETCGGTGISYNNTCALCHGNGKLREYVSFGNLKNDLKNDLIEDIKLDCSIVDSLISNGIAYKLLEDSDFIDGLLEKVGHRMEPDNAP